MHDFKTSKEMAEHMYHKMHHKRNFYIRAFFVNLALITLAWLLSMSGPVQSLLGYFMQCGANNAESYMLHLLAAWKIANVLFFLAPGLAAWWEMCMSEKNM